MTDQELIEIIATKVMGEKIIIRGCGLEFNPLASDADCMEAWDKFGISHEGHIFEGDLCDIFLHKTGASRRRSMCECMVKAATNAQ